MPALWVNSGTLPAAPDDGSVADEQQQDQEHRKDQAPYRQCEIPNSPNEFLEKVHVNRIPRDSAFCIDHRVLRLSGRDLLATMARRSAHRIRAPDPEA